MVAIIKTNKAEASKVLIETGVPSAVVVGACTSLRVWHWSRVLYVEE